MKRHGGSSKGPPLGTILEALVLGPLPPLHRFLVSLLALVACIGLGAWLAVTLPVPLIAPAGAAIGAGLGLVLVTLVLHDHGPRAARTRRTR